ATKLKNAAQRTATRGDRTRVETTVAIELAASWKPLMTSKMSATATPRTMTVTVAPPAGSCVMEDHAVDDVGPVLAPVGGVLEVLVDLLPLDDGDRIPLLLEEPGHRRAEDVVGLVLHPVDLDAGPDDGLGILHVAQPAQRALDLLRGAQEHRRHRLALGRQVRDLEERDPPRGRLDVVHDVVHPRDQAMDVVALDGRDEGLVQRLHAMVRDHVGFVLDLLDPLGGRDRVDLVRGERQELLHPLDGLGRVALEEVEEARLLWQKPPEHGDMVTRRMQDRNILPQRAAARYTARQWSSRNRGPAGASSGGSIAAPACTTRSWRSAASAACARRRCAPPARSRASRSPSTTRRGSSGSRAGASPAASRS